jgi:hypothetical protein
MTLRLDATAPTAPEGMTARERLDEIASIFARVILRLHGRFLDEAAESGDSNDSAPTCLDLSTSSNPDRVTG